MKKLEIDTLLKYTKSQFDKLKDTRADNKQYSMGDAVQSGLAIFSLKDSSMLEFNKRITERAGNLKRIFKINNPPPDGEVRKLLDEVAPVQIERVKRGVLQLVKEKGLFEEFEYFKGYKLLLIDGVHHFSSNKIKCVNCLETNHQDGSIIYSHSMLSAVIAHPEKQVVLPLCEEPIIQQDGVTKNDCELNASKRLLKKVRTRHLAEWRMPYMLMALISRTFKHNFGHGHNNLCTNFALLMLLAFLIDQIQQLSNELFQKALKKSEWKKYLWDDVRSFFKTMPFDSMEMIYNAIIYGFKIEYLAIRQSSD